MQPSTLVGTVLAAGLSLGCSLPARTSGVSSPAMPGEGASEAPLGRTTFSVNAPEPARRHFIRGMLALHSFWYDEARDEFHAATREAPGFAMGYWGEAMTYYHPVWDEENPIGSRAAMAKIPATIEEDERDQGLIAAARVLFGEGERAARWESYAEALGKLHRRFPDDDEITTLYAVAILGNAYRERYGDDKHAGFRRFAEAGALALDVLARNPQHPGAAHYVIHAFDDPEHAVLALPAARVYATIAPEAYHARHMPSHIFVQLGMWPEAAASNEAAWAASKEWAAKKRLDTSSYDFHSLSWLLSISLELGQRRRADEVLGRAFEALGRAKDPDYMPLLVGQMAAEYILKTGAWERLDTLLAPLSTVERSIAGSATQAAMPGCAGHVAASAARAGRRARAWLAFMQGEAAAVRKDEAQVSLRAVELAALEGGMDKHEAEEWKVRELELTARAAELTGKPDVAVEALRRAIALEESAPPAGPANDIPARELLGDLLLRSQRPREALRELRGVLALHPRRARALLGAARAATAAGDPSARDYCVDLASIWSEADGDEPALAEVQRCAAAR